MAAQTEMSDICYNCGGELIFRYLDGVLTPIHLSGGCNDPGSGSALTQRSSGGFADDFCRKTRCPYCGDEVYFIRHNGGSVWVDELGWPWPRHGCFGERNEGGPVPTFSAIDKESPAALRLGVVDWGERGAGGTTRLLVKRQGEWRLHILTVRGDQMALVGELVAFAFLQPIMTSRVRGHEFVRILSDEELYVAGTWRP